MQLLKKYFVFLIFILPLLAVAQDSNEELISWNTSNRLAWGDYKSKPDPVSDAAASTSTYLGIQYNFTNNSISYKITCFFSKNRSWGRFKTDYILSHEQGHFDITEIFARKLNKKMKDYVFNRTTYQKDLQKIYQDVLDEKEKMQEQYDDETDYSRNKEKQAEWLKKIEKMLDELKDFQNYS